MRSIIEMELLQVYYSGLLFTSGFKSRILKKYPLDYYGT